MRVEFSPYCQWINRFGNNHRIRLAFWQNLRWIRKTLRYKSDRMKNFWLNRKTMKNVQCFYPRDPLVAPIYSVIQIALHRSMSRMWKILQLLSRNYSWIDGFMKRKLSDNSSKILFWCCSASQVQALYSYKDKMNHRCLNLLERSNYHTWRLLR